MLYAAIVAVGLLSGPKSPIPAACTARFDQARAELIRRGFAPTADKNTARWLRVDYDPEYPELGLSLRLEMRTAADGAATIYGLNVNAAGKKDKETAGWRQRRGRYCCDDNAAPEDNLFEHRWWRVVGRRRAVISIVEFKESGEDPDVKRWRAMFSEVAREAADDCLKAAGPP